jgi:hypothetical protein
MSTSRDAVVRRVASGASALLAAALLALPGGQALASGTQETLFQDDVQLQTDPAATLARLKLLGVDRVRLAVRWYQIAPGPFSRRRPSNFRATDPAAYPKQSWAPWDRIVEEAANQGVGLDLDLMGNAPLWATGPAPPKDHKVHANWMPSAREFGAFVRAIGARYSGNYNPRTGKLDPGNRRDLPAVHFWSVWNEPDYGPSLAPQGAPGNLKVERSPWLYRNLLDAAWASLGHTGHAHDTILFGEVAPRGFPNREQPRLAWGVFSGMKPLTFVLALYCLDSRYRPLHGAAAAQRGCPTTAAASRRFRAAHPALFLASGFADHPYSRWYPPNFERVDDPGYSVLADLPRFERELDRITHVYGSGKRFPIWSTEYGYLTSPPKHSPDPKNRIPYINQSTAAYFLNWAEYISWRNPRLMSFAQYLLSDPVPANRSNDYGGFASGLLTYARREKPTYSAFRLPIFMPQRSAHPGQSLEVWGCARPSRLQDLVSRGTQTLSIQLSPGSGRPFKTVETVPIMNPRGYFDVRVVFPSSGSVRLAWSYPAGQSYIDPLPVYSRLERIQIR